MLLHHNYMKEFTCVSKSLHLLVNESIFICMHYFALIKSYNDICILTIIITISFIYILRVEIPACSREVLSHILVYNM